MVSTFFQNDLTRVRSSQSSSSQRLDVAIAREEALAERFKVRMVSCLHAQYAMILSGPQGVHSMCLFAVVCLFKRGCVLSMSATPLSVHAHACVCACVCLCVFACVCAVSACEAISSCVDTRRISSNHSCNSNCSLLQDQGIREYMSMPCTCTPVVQLGDATRFKRGQHHTCCPRKRCLCTFGG